MMYHSAAAVPGLSAPVFITMSITTAFISTMTTDRVLLSTHWAVDMLLWTTLGTRSSQMLELWFWASLCCRYSILRDKQLSLFEGQTTVLSWGTNSYPFLRDKQLSLFEGQTTVPFGETNNCPFWRDTLLPLLMDKQLSYLGDKQLKRDTQYHVFLRDKQLSLFEGQAAVPLLVTKKVSVLLLTA